ncbi:MAG TPA: hypothetical protein VFA18_00525, partial [Gemmataceae bacterium]|nr:hypothetical protein [Gemmataceae bacterium]
MKKYCFFSLCAVLVLVGVAVWFDPEARVLGYLRHDQFFADRPTSYWRNALKDTDPKTHVATRKTLLAGKAAAVPVLVEVLQKD